MVKPFEGTVTLRKVPVPVGGDAGAGAVDAVVALADALDAFPLQVIFVHVGPYQDIPQLELPERPGLEYRTVNYREGGVVERILSTIDEEGVDLVAMATHGHDSWWDRIAGSRTERVLRESPVPVLMTPIAKAG